MIWSRLFSKETSLEPLLVEGEEPLLVEVEGPLLVEVEEHPLPQETPARHGKFEQLDTTFWQAEHKIVGNPFESHWTKRVGHKKALSAFEQLVPRFGYSE